MCENNHRVREEQCSFSPTTGFVNDLSKISPETLEPVNRKAGNMKCFSLPHKQAEHLVVLFIMIFYNKLNDHNNWNL